MLNGFERARNKYQEFISRFGSAMLILKKKKMFWWNGRKKKEKSTLAIKGNGKKQTANNWYRQNFISISISQNPLWSQNMDLGLSFSSVS